MIMNMLVILVWIAIIGLFGVGFFVKDLIKDWIEEKEYERLWS